MYKIDEIYREGGLAYLLKACTSPFKLVSQKFRKSFVGLLIINMLLDSKYFKLRDLEK